MKIGVIYLFESFNKGEINHELDLQLVFSVFFSQKIYSQLLQIFIFTVLSILLLATSVLCYQTVLSVM